MSEFWVFWIVAPVAIGSAFAMLWSRHPVHSAMFLVLNLMSLAVVFVLLDAHFLGVVQLIVYAGAIMVLFLFVLMLVGVDSEESLAETLPGHRVVASLLVVLFTGGIFFVVRTAFDRQGFAGLAEVNRPGNTQAVGRLLFGKYLFAFEVTSILLIIAAIGAMFLGRPADAGEAPEAGDPDVSMPDAETVGAASEEGGR